MAATSRRSCSSLPSETAYLGLVRELTKKMAEIAGFAEPVAERLSLAVDEAATNVIEHAYKGAPDREVELRFEDRGAGLPGGAGRHRATWWTRARCPRSTSTSSSPSAAPAAWAMHLMERIMDSVTFRRSARRNVCALVKHKDKEGEGPSAR